MLYLTGAAGAVVELDGQLLAQTAFEIDTHRLRETNQLWRDQDLEVFVAQTAIRSEVLVFRIGVDRHLSDAASTNGLDEVNSHRAASLSEEFFGVRCHFDLHGSEPPLV